MNAYLLNRQSGSISPAEFEIALTYRLSQSLQSSSDFRFTIRRAQDAQQRSSSPASPWPAGSVHHGGVNSIAIDRFEGR